MTAGGAIAATASDHAGALDGLESLVRDCTAAGVARRVMLLRTDLLPPRLTRADRLQLAQTALDPLMAAERARAHALPSDRLAVSWRGDAPALLQRSLGTLERLLGEHGRPGEAPLQDVVRLFDLPRDGDALLEAAGSEGGPGAAPFHPNAAAEAPLSLMPLDAAALSVLEAQLATADMARFARRTPVCRVDGSRVHLSWEQRHLSVSELTATLAPGYSAQADAWLFRRLTRVLDRRMLALLSAPRELRGAGPFSVNLNVASVLSPEFLRFDAALPSALHGRVVLDIQPADLLADPAAFVFARDFARTRGYRVQLRDVTAALLPLLRLPRMELDFVQLRWSANLAAADPVLLQAGTAQWVLGEANEAVAVRWGKDQGISLFQGRAVTMTA